MSDPILLFLAVDVAALLLLGTFAATVPLAGVGFIMTGLCGLGAMLCLPSLLMRTPAAAFGLPVGPPGLSLHFALDPLSTCFLLITLLAGTAIAAFQATSVPPAPMASMRVTALCVAGTSWSLIAADGVALGIGLVIACAAVWLSQTARRNQAMLLIPLLLLTAVSLLTPAGFAPRFDTIRAAPLDPDHAPAATAMVIAAVTGLIWFRPSARCWTRDALIAGMIVPLASYLLLRLVADLSGSPAQTFWGFMLLLIGGTVAIIQGWRSAIHPDIDGAVACLVRRQAGLSMIGVGLALIARTADLPGAASLAFAATLLLAIGGGIAGSATSLAVHAIGRSAGTYRLSRLGGLIDRMPSTSAALAAGLMGLAAVPPGFGFACLWLLLQSILSAPRTSGLLFELPLALVAAAIALSAALATAAAVRLAGIAVLGRPRTPQGAGAQEVKSVTRIVLLALAVLSLLTGILPGPALWLLANPAILVLTGAPPGSHIGLGLFSSGASSPGYLALPVVALLALATGAVMLIPRGSRKDSKAAGFWANGMEPPVGLPFGDPAAQSAGAGFVPTLPVVGLPPIPRLSWFPRFRRPSSVAGLWLLLGAFGMLLLVLSVAG